jgi:hypothetical protein
VKAAYGKVVDVRSYISLQVCKIVIEVPIEYHVEATALLYGRNVLATLAQLERPYGIVESTAPEDQHIPTAHDSVDALGSSGATLKGGELCKLACIWCKDEEFHQYLTEAYPVFFGGRFPQVGHELAAKELILTTCGNLSSRRELDHNANARRLFDDYIRRPFMKWKAAASA